MLVTEYNQLNEEQTGDGGSQQQIAAAHSKNKLPQGGVSKTASSNKKATIERKGSAGSDDNFSPLYENVINSLERRQREREQQKCTKQQEDKEKSEEEKHSEGVRVNGGSKGANVRDDSIESLSGAEEPDDPASSMSNSTSGPIPAYLLEEARQLRQSKTRLESRKVELEKCNQLLESQLTHFKTYINNSGALDAKTKKRLAKSIVEMERMLDSTPSSSTPSTPMKSNKGAMELLLANSARRSSATANGANHENNSNSDSTSTPLSSTYTPSSSLLHTAADQVNSAVENLVEAYTEPEDNDASDYTSSNAAPDSNGSRYNGMK